MNDVDKDRKVLIPSFNVNSFDDIKEHTVNLLDSYRDIEDEIPDMLLVIQSQKNEDGTYTIFMGASPENNLKQIKFYGDIANIEKLLIERKE